MAPKPKSKTRRWQVDFDYDESLPPDAKEWLSDFTRRYYGGDFGEAPPEDWPTAVKQAVWSASWSSRNDLYTHALLGARLDHIPDRGGFDIEAPPVDLNPPAPHLEHPEYRRALAEFRAALRQDQRDRPPADTPSLRRAAKTLRAITHPDTPTDEPEEN